MSYCTQCGTENPEDAKFCHFCGRSTAHQSDEAHPTIPSPSKPSAFVIVANLLLLFVIQGALLFVVPVFGAMFEDFGSKLPFLTRILVDASDFWKGWWLLCDLPLAVAVIFLFKHPPRQVNLVFCLRLAALLQGLLIMAGFLALALPIVQLGSVASGVQ